MNKKLLIIVAACVTLLIVGIFYVVLFDQGRPPPAEVAKATTVQAQGQAASAQDANKVVIQNSTKTKKTDTQTQENRRAIITTPGANVTVDAGVDAAGRRAICMRQSARNLPECEQLRGAGPGGVVQGRGSVGPPPR